jgi:hypothetical protein
MTIADFARAVGCTPQAVSRGIQRGRLPQSVSRDERGRPSIADFGLARAEWERSRSRLPRRPARDASSNGGPSRFDLHVGLVESGMEFGRFKPGDVIIGMAGEDSDELICGCVLSPEQARDLAGEIVRLASPPGDAAA